MERSANQAAGLTPTASRTGSHRRWSWAVAVATLVVFVIANASYPTAEVGFLWTAMFSLIVGAFVCVGALLTSRVPGNPIGPLILWSGALLAATIAIGTLGIVAADRGDVPLELVALAAVINDIGFQLPIVVILIGIPLIFPDGHLLSARWRWLVLLVVASMVAVAFTALVGPGPAGAVEVDNPFEVPTMAPVVEILDALASWSSIVGFAGAVLAVVIRYRRGDDVQRHQLKWLIAVALLAAVSFPIGFMFPDTPVGEAGIIVGLVAMLALPMAIGVAVLRYRLYEIDRIISRTIAWAIVSALIVAAFVALVVGLQNVLAGFTQGETLAVAVSTLAAVALFQPLRSRVQRVVDRRFDRARYDARDTADAFAERVREEVDLDALANELHETVARTIRPSSLRIWLPPRDPSG